MATLAPVCRIRSITDKEELIVDLLFSVRDDLGNLLMLDAGFAIISLKSKQANWSYNVPMNIDRRRYEQEFISCLENLCDFIRKQRGYE